MQVEGADTTIFNSGSTGSLTRRITFLEYFFVFVLILYSGRANTFFDTSSFKNNPFGSSVLILFGIILALKWRIKFDSRFFGLLFGTIIYFLAISIKYKVFHPTFLLDYFSLFFIVYIVIKTLKFDLFKIYESVLYILALVGLFFWVVQI